MSYTATYSPEDNKLRLYSVSRLPPELYARVKAAGFKWAPAQSLFVAPMWTPERAELLEELAGEIGDEDTSLAERAEERAERFGDYKENRERDANAAQRAVAAIADGIPFGQPILVGHHSERHARRDAEKIENGMRRAVKMWDTAQYWQDRARGALRHAKYKERPDVRARRIKGLEADLRKFERDQKKSDAELLLWSLVDKPEKWKDGPNAPKTREERAFYVAGRVSSYVCRVDGESWSAYDILRPAEERYKACPVMTLDEVLAALRENHDKASAYRAKWIAHTQNRLAYERAMLGEQGGTIADRTAPEVGGAVKCWASPAFGRGWSYIQKVNRVSVTIYREADYGGRVLAQNMALDKLAGIMTRAQVEEWRARGQLAETEHKTGFFIPDGAPTPPKPDRDERPAEVEAMRETLRQGVQVVSAPQLFPTPREVAERMVELADIQPGARVLEPSAGTGMLLGAMGGRMFAEPSPTPYAARDQVHAVEINAALAERLRAEYPLTKVHCADFLQCNGDLGAFDRVLMNPPFQDGADIKHIRHALGMLAPGGRLVAICANGPRQAEALQPLADSWEELPRGTFAGTDVGAVLLTITKD